MMRKYLERVVSQAFGSSLLDGVARADVHGVLLAVQQFDAEEVESHVVGGRVNSGHQNVDGASGGRVGVAHDLAETHALVPRENIQEQSAASDAVHFSFAHPHDVPHDPRHEIARKEDGHLGLHGGNELGEPGSHSRILGVRRCTLGFSGELRQLVLASSVHETAEVGGQEASGEFVLLGIVVVEVWGKKMALVR